MATPDKQPALLLLDDGTVYKGHAAGKIGTTTGEICFNTSMTGYQEVFTDPSYYGQILVATNAHIGNYGIFKGDIESDSVKIAGLVVKNFNDQYSRKLADEAIDQYLKEQNVVSISDVDTRALVRHIRSKGAMNAIISSEILDQERLKEELQKVPSMAGLELSTHVTTKSAHEMGESQAPYRVAVLDLGVKYNIIRNFVERGCYLKIFPAQTTPEEIMQWNPDGFFISNGPGDPAAMPYAVATAKYFLEKDLPTFGICLGHQILAEAIDIPTYKMHHGHRGANHPVKNVITGHCEITTQNHGFGVSPEAIEANKEKVEITHVNLNDGTVEGIKINGKKAFSVQYHPESSPGPHDSRYLFDDFINLIKEAKSI